MGDRIIVSNSVDSPEDETLKPLLFRTAALAATVKISLWDNIVQFSIDFLHFCLHSSVLKPVFTNKMNKKFGKLLLDLLSRQLRRILFRQH